MSQQHQLISIPASHYCERARWALDYAGIPFVEHKWPPMLHYAATLPASGTRTVPVLLCPATANRKAHVLTDSQDIVRYTNDKLLEAAPSPLAPAMGGSSQASPVPLLYPSDPNQLREVERLEELFARKLGVWSRVVAYHYLFADRGAALDVLALRQRQPPALAGWKGAALRGGYGLVRTAICRGLRVDERGAAACLGRIRTLFREVGELLEAGGGRYLVGGRFTASDLTFASMAAILLVSEQYGAYLPPLDTWPAGFPARELRDTPAGRHALRMYELHRHRHGHQLQGVEGGGPQSVGMRVEAVGEGVEGAGVGRPGAVAEGALPGSRARL